MSTTPSAPTTTKKDQALVPAGQAAGTIARQDFGGDSLEVVAETASTALAAQARATVEARFIVAMKRPRDIDTVRTKILRACERPGFAAEAYYRKPIGAGVEGFSVRFAEEAVRSLGNLDVQSVVTFDDPHKRIITVTVTDLEANIAYPTSVVIEKTVERSKLREKQVALRVRMNASNEPVYIVEATDDELLAKQNSIVSKTLRNGVLRILPGDIQAEAKRRILEIRRGEAAKDPDKLRRTVTDAFAELNVLPSALKTYLGHDLGTATPAELNDLRDLYSAIKAGEATWQEVLEEKLGGKAPEPEKKAALDGVADKLKGQATGPCTHPKVTADVLATVPVGQKWPCDLCGVALEGTKPLDPAAVADSEIDKAQGKKPTQRKLSE